MSKVLEIRLPQVATGITAESHLADAVMKALAKPRAGIPYESDGYNRVECAELIVRVRPDDPVGLSSVRATLREHLNKWGLASVGDTAVLLASELVTNALRHSGGAALFIAQSLVNAVRLEVYDSCAAAPHTRAASEDDVSGRGMVLVETLARSWGADMCSTGKRVWCEIAVGRD